MPNKRLIEFLDLEKVKYVTITHSPAYTAQEVAASAHIPGKELAKTVIVKIDGELAMVVLPATRLISIAHFCRILPAKEVELAPEEEFKDRFPDCEVGALPPFGNLYDMEVHAAKSLAEEDQIAFNAGTHSELIRMDYVDYQRLVNPRILEFAEVG